MNKMKTKNGLGRALIKNRFGAKKHRLNNVSLLHTSELQDGYDWNKINLRSVTEEDSFKEFLSTAEVAGTEFLAEKLNVTFINPRSGVGLLSKEEVKKVRETQKQNKELLKIPRRPKWDSNTTAEQLQKREREEFLEWRRNLSLFQEESGLLLTPYEKNLDFWRQLWRVVERSDVLVQIVDARNPLLFRCEDLERYVTEVGSGKRNAVLCNKADFLTRSQRATWAKYFDALNVPVAFFSALQSADAENDDEPESDTEVNNDDRDNPSNNELETDSDEYITEEEEEVIGGDEIGEIIVYHKAIKNSSKLLSREGLINFFRTFRPAAEDSKNILTVGLVGYPNVGKSSTINALLTHKKVAVSATPGKTKHFQTVYLDQDILLCDCPGLVMPSFVLTKADMILNGILPIDQLRDHVPPVNLLCTKIPRPVLENTYGIMIPRPDEGEDPQRPPFSEELLNAYAYNRGFMTANGQPDNPRAARYILKDYVNGKLLYCYAPPGHIQEKFHKFKQVPIKSNDMISRRLLRVIKPFNETSRDMENFLSNEKPPDVHSKGYHLNSYVRNTSVPDRRTEENTKVSKPWKNHKNKRNRHEKLRNKYAYLDE